MTMGPDAAHAAPGGDRAPSRRGRALAAGGLATLWVAGLVYAPIVARHPDHAAGLVQRAIGLVYLTGGLVCHQRPERSLFVGGAPMPVCGRCFGLYAAGALGLLVSSVAPAAGRRLRERQLVVASALPTALAWLAEWGGLADVSTAERVLLALPLGAVLGWVVGNALWRDAPSGYTIPPPGDGG